MSCLWGFLTRIRLVLALVALAFSVSMVSLALRSGFQWGYVYGGFQWWVLCDYTAWLATLLACFAAYLDLKVFWDDSSYASTILLSLVGFATTLFGRIASLCLNASVTIPAYVGPLLGSYYTREGFFCAAACLISGSTLTAIGLFIHTVVGRPIIFRKSETPAELFEKQWLKFLKAWKSYWSRPGAYLAAAFLTGFICRLIPEILWWPWPVGSDTVEYIAHLADFAVSLNPFKSYYWMGGMRNCPPLLNIILLPVSAIAGAWATLKIYPPVAYGMLALSSTLLARKAYGLNRSGSFFASMITAFYVLNLRISADYQRQLLGSVFMLLTLVALDSWRRLDARKALSIAVLIVCSALSHEVTALFSAAVSLVLTLKSIGSRDYRGLTVGLIGLMASATLEIWYWRKPYTPSPVFGIVPAGLVSYSEDASPMVVSYLLAGYGLTLPFAIAALLQQKEGWIYTETGLAALMLAGVSPMLAPYTAAATWYRFLIGAAPIVSTLAATGIYRMSRDERFPAAYLMLVMIPGLAFTYSIGTLSRFTGALREFASGFTPSPSSIGLLEDLKKLAEWLSAKNLNGTIVVDSSIANWVHIGVRNPTPSSFIRVSSSVSSGTLEALLEGKQEQKLYAVTRENLTANGQLRVEKLRDGVYKVYLVEKKP
jgi:hypothetical protein